MVMYLGEKIKSKANQPIAGKMLLVNTANKRTNAPPPKTNNILNFLFITLNVVILQNLSLSIDKMIIPPNDKSIK